MPVRVAFPGSTEIEMLIEGDCRSWAGVASSASNILCVLRVSAVTFVLVAAMWLQENLCQFFAVIFHLRTTRIAETVKGKWRWDLSIDLTARIPYILAG
jgi:hypothetical protein